MLPIPNHLHYQNSHQHLTLNTAGYPTTPPHISLPPDSLSPISPQYFSNQASQLNQSHLPLLNILSPFSKQLFPTYPHCQLPPAWMQLPQTTPPTTPPTRHTLPQKSPNRENRRSSSMHNRCDQAAAQARERREIASATCLKAQEDFNLSTCTDDTAIALTLCCSATTRLSSVLEDPPVEWDDQILHQLRSTRRRYSERWRGLYRSFILKKVSAQPPSPIPDESRKKTKVQMSQYIQCSTDVQKTPRKCNNKPLKSILKKPGNKNTDNQSLSTCSLEALSNSSLAISFPPLLKETGTQTSPTSSLFKSLQLTIKDKDKENFPPPHSTATYRTLYPPTVKPQPNETIHQNLPMKRSTCFTPPPPRRFSPDQNTHFTATTKTWTCTEV
eukprot:TRINITY_DN6441_c0_g1_i1.p1 TRINITY_DN6441_c0_g1~~TRINITY_DN6441_c0_g1_i1.p1  ORF type:complete len:386 (-),score=58.05 TRINITY_DN6441_c0_g1_i1:68-1225(-)